MVPGTYTQVYIHLVFAVKYRQSLLHKSFRQEVFSYMGGIFSKLGHIPLIVNGVEDHVHSLYIMSPNVSIAETAREVKRASAMFIKDNYIKSRFQWQRGYGAFSYSQSQLDRIIHYIETQEEHHRKKTFREEYIGFLKAYQIEYKEEFLFDFLDKQ